MLNSIIVLAIVVLPGWLSLSVNQRYYPRIVDRSIVMSWGILLYHAMMVHLIGVAMFATIVLIWRTYFLDTLGLDQILMDGPVEFTKKSPGTAFAVFSVYTLWMLVGSTVTAIMDLPAKMVDGIGRAANLLRLARSPVNSDEPVWFRALNLDRDKSNVQVCVRMKNGDVYVGDLKSYTVLPFSDESRDLRLGDSVRYTGDDSSPPVELDFSDYGGGGVLLSTNDISSIEYMFHNDYEWDGQSAAD